MPHSESVVKIQVSELDENKFASLSNDTLIYLHDILNYKEPTSYMRVWRKLCYLVSSFF